MPLVPHHHSGDPQAAELVAQRIDAMAAHGTRIRWVMMDRLGPNAWQRSPANESAALEES
ncbi:MAG: aldolase, partial [Proteobacteria bacterium]|nr:aldolase [Pseudomonadota bacterium]